MTASRGIRARRGTRIAWALEQQGQHLCHCGCEQPVRVVPEHYNLGIPRYLHGHNARLQERTVLPQVPCACGCGELATPGKEFVSGHNRRGDKHTAKTRAQMSATAMGRVGLSGPASGTYKRGYYITRHGYRMTSGNQGHPFAIGSDRGSIFEHRLVLERHLRGTDPSSHLLVTVDGERYLSPEVEVHHIDGDKLNNDVVNLLPLSKIEHARLHAEIKRSRRLVP